MEKLTVRFAVRGVAQPVHAEDLLMACEQYERNNVEFIQRVQQSRYSRA